MDLAVVDIEEGIVGRGSGDRAVDGEAEAAGDCVVVEAAAVAAAAVAEVREGAFTTRQSGRCSQIAQENVSVKE
jgi:hypothetical protein